MSNTPEKLVQITATPMSEEISIVDFLEGVIRVVSLINYNSPYCGSWAVRAILGNTEITVRDGDSLDTLMELWALKRGRK